MNGIARERGRHIAVLGGGMAGLEFAQEAAAHGCTVEIIEPGPRTRTRHVNWDDSVHPGDEKTRSWTTAGWGPNGGLSERLGGRSLCYHGVLLGLEPPALDDWGDVWRERLAGDDGAYAAVLNRLAPEFPELKAAQENLYLHEFGLQHTPQGARLDASGRFEAYSPLSEIHNLLAAGRVTVTRGRAHSVARGHGGTWNVVVDGEAKTTRTGFDACVLAASAIGNVQILAQSLERDIETTVTDHFSVGAFARLRPGTPLTEFRHPMLWSGYAPLPSAGANLFVLEWPSLPNGDRLIEVMAVVEQRGGTSAHSELSVRKHEDATETHIRAKISRDDEAHLQIARDEILRKIEAIAGARVETLSASAGATNLSSGKHDDADARWRGHDTALATVRDSADPNVLSWFELPYGAFEHEACSHPIGDDHPVAVSPDLEVRELPGVFVAGPGAFPRLGAANPALTILGTSRWLGQHVAKETI